MFIQLLIGFIILSSLSFFYLSFLGGTLINLAQFLSIGLIFLFIIISSIYNKGKKFQSKFKIEIYFLLFSLILSMFGANMLHDQSFGITAITQRSIYFFLVYFLLHHIRANPYELTKLMVIFSILFISIYIIQFVIYPIVIVNTSISVERGTIRIGLSGAAYAFFTYFFAISKYFLTRKRKFIFLAILMLSIFILLGSRQLIGTVVFLTFMYLIFTKQIKSKPVLFLVIFISIIPLYFVFQEVFVSLFEVSLVQNAQIEDEVRIKAVKFFLIDFFPNKISYLIGNGAASINSEYGRQILYYKENFGYYQSDIGMIGELSMYGIIFIIAELSILFRVIFMKLPQEIGYIKFIFIGVLMMSFTGGGGFSEAENIVSICLLLYLIDAHFAIDTKLKKGTNVENNYINSSI